MIIYILSQIWKSGADIYRDPQDGRLTLKNAENVTSVILKAAEPVFDDIELYFKSVEAMNNVDKTIWKMQLAFCGWKRPENITEFFATNERAVELMFDYHVALSKNGWSEIYSDYRAYETEETEKIKREIYKLAVAFAKG